MRKVQVYIRSDEEKYFFSAPKIVKKPIETIKKLILANQLCKDF